MGEKIVKNFSVKRIEILDKEGNVDETLMPELDNETIKKMYEWMVFTRIFDDTLFRMQREGRIGTYAQTFGQEAQVGTAFAMAKDDWFFPSFREHGILMTRGLPPELLIQYFAGDYVKIPNGVNCFPIAVPVSTQTLHAVGAAWAFKTKKEKKASVVYLGDGGTSKGDFHEGMNFAGALRLPCVIVCQNNQWAISVPRSRQTAAETIAQKAIAYGFEGVQVDGNDIFAVYKAMKDAIEKAHSGGGPTFIECETYRMGHHTTSDDATRYRTEEDVKMWAQRDPIERLRKYLEKKGLWNQKYEQELITVSEEKVAKAVKTAEGRQTPTPESIFDNVYDKPTKELEEQREYLLKVVKKEQKNGVE